MKIVALKRYYISIVYFSKMYLNYNNEHNWFTVSWKEGT